MAFSTKSWSFRTWMIWGSHFKSSSKNSVTPPAMTPRNLTFFPASQFAVLQPFQGFVTFAFWHDLHFYWYLHDFVVVFMNLQWSKHSFFVPIHWKNEVFVFFTCKSLPTCQVLSISHPWPHCISTQNCICNLESFDSTLDWRNFWTPTEISTA